MTEDKPATNNEHEELEKRDAGIFLRPPVDISEDDHGITLIADMPGVSSERLTLQASNDSLLIEGEARIDMPEGMEALYADVRSTRYRRQFQLSSELDTNDIEASLKAGVLHVRIPKRAEVRPRKIEVRAD